MLNYTNILQNLSFNQSKEKFSRARWIITATVAALVAINTILVVGCVGSETPPQPVSTIPSSNSQATGLTKTLEPLPGTTATSILPMKENESGESVVDTCGNDYILFQEGAINSSLILVEESGYSEFVLFDAGHKKILQYTSGNLTAQNVNEVFNLVEKDFFRMQDSYVLKAEEGKEDLLLLDSITQTIFVCRDGKAKSVLVQGTGQLPEAPLEFKQITNSLKEGTSKLKKDSRYGTFIRAKLLEGPGLEAWVEGLKATGVEFNLLTTEQLESYPFLKQAIVMPSQFVHVGDLDHAELKELMRKENPSVFFVTFKEEDFEIAIFIRSK